jgi:hypothetical protein
MKTLPDWLKRHPNVKARMFERNYRKQRGSGEFEIVCGFCLASHRFRSRHPRICVFCQAPIRAARSISDLPEVLNQLWRLVSPAKTRSLGKQTHMGRERVSKSKPASRALVPGRKLARMSPYEDKCWVFALCYWLDRGKTDEEAGRLAWRDIQLEFPRLQKYEGCKP